MAQSKNMDREIYKCLERYVLSPRQISANCYPLPDPSGRDLAIIDRTNYVKRNSKLRFNLPNDECSCDRCNALYRVNAKEVAVKELSRHLFSFIVFFLISFKFNSIY